MERRGSLLDNLSINYVVYILIVVAVFVLLFLYIVAFADRAALWEDFYAKEIVRLIDDAEPGQEIALDVSEGVLIAQGNHKDRSSIFTVDNAHNVVSVSLRQGGSTRFSFFHDVDVIDMRPEIAGEGDEIHVLRFHIVEVQRDDA